jgi:prepilin-type N-terminal cleavage/methylation domain-containing protein/prepilin-type processing-associated H-X9-DG protein
MSRIIHKGFTLTELLVVLAIIAILIGLLLPSVRNVRGSANRMQCSNNLKQQMLAFHNYNDTHGHFPPYQVKRIPAGFIGEVPEERLSVMVALLPYLERENVFRQFDLEKGYEGNLKPAQTRINVFECPGVPKSNPDDAVTHYVALAGIGLDAAKQPLDTSGNGFLGYDRITSLDKIKDGLSNTIGLMETNSQIGPWARGGNATIRGLDPTDLPWSGPQRPFGGNHPGGLNVAMADGSVRFLRDSLDLKKLKAAITIAGEEKEELD